MPSCMLVAPRRNVASQVFHHFATRYLTEGPSLANQRLYERPVDGLSAGGKGVKKGRQEKDIKEVVHEGGRRLRTKALGKINRIILP